MPAPIYSQRIKQRPYGPRGGALRMWGCRDEEILFEGPAGTGKSRGVLEKIFFCMQKYAGMRAMIIRKTRESCTESVLVTFEEKVIPVGHPMLEGPSRRLRANYKHPNGSECIIGGLDKPDKIMSTEYDLIAVFEATETTLEGFEQLTSRLRNGIMPYQQIIADCNPSVPSHWLNKRAMNPNVMTRILSRHEDNPMWFDNGQWTDAGKKYLNKLGRLTGARLERLKKGKWAAQEGMVYEDFDTLLHVIPRFPIPKSWKRYLSIDFGFKNPFVAQWWAENNDGDLFLYREIYKSHRIVADHALQIKAFSKGETFSAIVSDHDAEDRATLHENGILTIPAHKLIMPGIQAVQARMRLNDTTKKPRIFFLEDSVVEVDTELDDAGLPTSTIQEIEGYVWKKNDENKVVKEEPVDINNHGMDAMRYLVSHTDNVAAMTLNVVAEETAVVERQ